MSSESLEDKLDNSEKNEVTKEGDLSPVSKEEDKETTNPVTHLSEGKEEPHELPVLPTEDSDKLAKEIPTAKEVDEPAAEVESETVKPADK